jgi:hypothetical protein
MNERDQRFKRLLQEFLGEFLVRFFPHNAAALNLSQVEWLDKELFAAALEGEVQILDLVARLRRTDAGAADLLTLVHIEVESRDAVATFRPRMYHYYEYLRRTYGCPVLPIAVYLRVGLDGIGIDTYMETYDGLEVLRFQYLYVGLPALDAIQYLTGTNWLGVALAALMRIPDERRAWLRAEALRRVLVECQENDYRRLLLTECIEAYLTLDEQQQNAFEHLLRTPLYQEVIPMMKTTFEKGMEKGQRNSARLVLEKKFGPLTPTVQQRLEEWPAERLDELLLALVEAPSLKALELEE